MRTEKYDRYTTDSELDFLDRLGRHGEHRSEVRRINALEGYIKAAPMRADWAGIDRGRVLAHAIKLLA
jgi:hypothetical protein